MVGGHRVLPEIFLLERSGFGGKVCLHDANDFVDGRDAVAVGVVASKDDAILAEDADQIVEPAAIRVHVERDLTVDAVSHRRQLDVDLRTFADFGDHFLVRLDRLIDGSVSLLNLCKLKRTAFRINVVYILCTKFEESLEQLSPKIAISFVGFLLTFNDVNGNRSFVIIANQVYTSSNI